MIGVLKQSKIKLSVMLAAIIAGAILIWLVVQSTRNTQSLQQIRQGISTLNHDEIIITQSLKHLSQQATQWQQQDHQNNATALQQLKQFDTILQTLKQRLDQLNDTMNALPATITTIHPVAPPQQPVHQLAQATRRAAAGYRIYAVEPYGVVIGTPSGQFHIVRVGEVIPKLGQVESISADQVLVGQRYVIRPG
jgi:septal ring factor EnvC (AmiA/AmiB activator)